MLLRYARREEFKSPWATVASVERRSSAVRVFGRSIVQATLRLVVRVARLVAARQAARQNKKVLHHF
jgi:hypothetical protein